MGNGIIYEQSEGRIRAISMLWVNVMGGKRLLVIVGLLLALLIVPVSFFLGVVDVPKFSFISAPASSTVEPASSSTPTAFVDPVNTIDEALQSGSYFTVHVNISDVTDLFAWQINMSWDPSILNVSRIIAGEFLNRTTSESKTAAYQLGFVINATDNAKGYTAMGESILGGVPGINGSGRLVTIEFLVTEYGWTDLNISLTGNLATTLLNSTGGTITFTKTDGYFSNKILGDVDGDGDVDRYDVSIFAGAYGSRVGDPNYNDQCDFDRDGDVDRYDVSALAGNYGRTI